MWNDTKRECRHISEKWKTCARRMRVRMNAVLFGYVFYIGKKHHLLTFYMWCVDVCHYKSDE